MNQKLNPIRVKIVLKFWVGCCMAVYMVFLGFAISTAITIGNITNISQLTNFHTGNSPMDSLVWQTIFFYPIVSAVLGTLFHCGLVWLGMYEPIIQWRTSEELNPVILFKSLLEEIRNREVFGYWLGQLFAERQGTKTMAIKAVLSTIHRIKKNDRKILGQRLYIVLMFLLKEEVERVARLRPIPEEIAGEFRFLEHYS